MDALCKLFRSRIRKCSDKHGVDRFQKQLSSLAKLDPEPLSQQYGLIRVESAQPIACQECGQYFTSIGQVRRHQTKVHGAEVSKSEDPPTHWRSHMLDGMPQCRHCRKTFTRVEGFRKHVKSFCPILHQQQISRDQPMDDKAPSLVAEPHGHSCRRAGPTRRAW